MLVQPDWPLDDPFGDGRPLAVDGAPDALGVLLLFVNIARRRSP